MVTYGSGNIPDSRTDLVEVIKGAVERGLVIVTCCPCRGGPHDVSTEYVEQVRRDETVGLYSSQIARVSQFCDVYFTSHWIKVSVISLD